MQPATIARLNALNQSFYATVADAFDQTRSRAWPGWARLRRWLPDRPLHVLDVGCGNGRFALFLAQSGFHIHYTGVDSSPALLDAARQALRAAGIDAALAQRDILHDALPDGGYDVVAAFGLMHHIPGAHTRREQLGRWAARVEVGGLLAYATWRFLDDVRLRGRVVPWPSDLAGEVEEGDYLLDWRQGAQALRYCHATDDREQAALDAASGLTLLERYRADGTSGQLNAYSVLRRE